MDGRTTEAVTNHIRENYGVKWVDFITEPGINKILAEDLDAGMIRRIRDKIHISVHRHEAEILAIAGHAKCAGNPADKERQIRQLKIAKKTVEAFGFDIDIILLWVESDWKTVEQIDHDLIQV